MQLIKTMSVICVACLVIFVSSALAEPAVVFNIGDQEGYLFDGDGNATLIFCDVMVVETNSSTGVITNSCRGKGLPNNSGRAVKYDIYNNPFYWQDGIEIPCAFITADGALVLTNDWTETISASGNYMFRCKVKID